MRSSDRNYAGFSTSAGSINPPFYPAGLQQEPPPPMGAWTCSRFLPVKGTFFFAAAAFSLVRLLVSVPAPP